MKRIISLKKVSPFLTEVYRDQVKIGTIDYQNAKDYQINLDDVIAQAVMDAEVAAIKKVLEENMNNFTSLKIKELDDYKNLTLVVELTSVKNDYIAEITQVFNEKKQLLLTDYENYKKNVTTESNAFKVSVEAEKKNISELGATELKKIKDEGPKQKLEVETLGNSVKNELEADYENYKNELEAIINVNNIEKLLGNKFKGPYTSDLKNGDIFYRSNINKITFEVPNSSSSSLNIIHTVEPINEFYVHSKSDELKFELINYKQKGIVELDFYSQVEVVGGTNRTSFEMPIIRNKIEFSIPDTSEVILVKDVLNINISSPLLEKENLYVPVHSTYITKPFKNQY